MATNGRFLTTHVGSLPRPDDLIAMMWAREDGIPVDKAAMEERVCRAVDEVVARQTKAGIDIVNDGEMGKPSYATYVKDRLAGFEGGKSDDIGIVFDLLLDGVQLLVHGWPFRVGVSL